MTTTQTKKRATFTSNFGLLMTMIGVAVGLGNVWRFPYMVGKFGGAVFVAFYLAMVLLVGIPALMAEWTLGRHTQRGTLGAFERSGFPGGKYVGYYFFFIVFCATGYYTNTIGWVLYYCLNQITSLFGSAINASAILPPETGSDWFSLTVQLMITITIISVSAFVISKGLNKGIEKISKFVFPSVLAILILIIFRSVTLEGASEGIYWYIGNFDINNLTPSVMAAALGQAIFSMSLGGTFMVVYGSYLGKNADIPKNALLTGLGDTFAGLLAGLAIFPAVFAFGLEPSSGPALIFFTLPEIFSKMSGGMIFGFLFYAGLFAAAFLSALGAFEVLAAGLVDNTKLTRKKSVVLIGSVVFVLAIPPMINMEIFIPWDLFFGSGMQILGAFLAVISTGWCINRSAALKELASGSKFTRIKTTLLYYWIRFVIPTAILFVGINWLMEQFW